MTVREEVIRYPLMSVPCNEFLGVFDGTLPRFGMDVVSQLEVFRIGRLTDPNAVHGMSNPVDIVIRIGCGAIAIMGRIEQRVDGKTRIPGIIGLFIQRLTPIDEDFALVTRAADEQILLRVLRQDVQPMLFGIGNMT